MSPRTKRHRKIGSPPVLKGFKPIGLSMGDIDDVSVQYEEYEAFRLVDYSGLSQEEAAKIMNVSRPTFNRIYNSCLQKIARAFAEGKSIVIEGGDVEFDKQWYRCNACLLVFHKAEEGTAKCISCKSGNIEHINKSIEDWREGNGFQSVTENEDQRFCKCQNCDYEVIHQRGVPCFTLTCPTCMTPLIRKD